MGKDSSIQWTHHTFNPWWGCTRVSPGCERCYAETFAHRLGFKVWGTQSERRFFGDKHWAEPLKWNKAAEKAGERHRVFCASMADVFEDRRDLDGERAKLFAVIHQTPYLDWLLLTKRPENMERLASATWMHHWPRSVWAGCTVEDKQRAEERMIHLRNVPAVIHFLSIEPQIEDLEKLDLTGIQWVIVGGESGNGARPFDLAWARKAIHYCERAGVACFIKQMGANPIVGSLGKRAAGITDSHGGDWNEWPADLRVRQFPDVRREGDERCVNT